MEQWSTGKELNPIGKEIHKERGGNGYAISERNHHGGGPRRTTYLG